MIIKHIDCIQDDIDVLGSMLSSNSLSFKQKKLIENEISNIKKGHLGEKNAAYELDFHLEKTDNFAVIHDLRIEYENRVAQIDHLVINRFFDFFVLESKNLSDTIVINDQGEFSAKYGNRSIGIASPIAQNEKHISVLNQLINSKLVKRPSILGFNIRPNFHNIVFIAQNTIIERPSKKSKLPWLNQVIKADEFIRYLDEYINKMSYAKAFIKIPKTIFVEELKDFAEQLSSQHKPIQVDWYARFGVSKPIKNHTPAKTPIFTPSTTKPLPKKIDVKKKSKLICHACKIDISFVVARFCWFNKPRFNNQIYCKNCQTKFPTKKGMKNAR